MPSFDLDSGFDVHEYRHGLKLLRDDGDSMQLANEAGFDCPACGRPFDRLFCTERSTATFESPSGPFCLARTDDQLLVLSH